MKVFWSSNAPWAPSGYGSQTALFCHRIRSLGHDLGILAFWGQQGAPVYWEDIMVYPGGASHGGNDVIVPFAMDYFQGKVDDGWIVTLQDVWTLTTDKLAEMHVASWVPVDHNPCPPAVAGYFARTGAVPIAMSRFGVEALEYQDLQPLYVPHGVDTQVLKPASKADRAEWRRLLRLPEDAFVVGMVAANAGNIISRKAFPEAFQAFARFKRKRPSAKLYMHTRTHVRDGMDLAYLASNFGIEDDIVWVEQLPLALGKITQLDMAGVYSTMDVLLNPSYGEGFGIPIIEAQACGVPVIVGDNTAMPELVGGGWTVSCTHFWDEFQRSFFFRPDVDSIVEGLEHAYHASDSMRRKAREKALEYDADLITQTYWRPVLESLEQMLGEREAAPVDQERLRAMIAEAEESKADPEVAEVSA